MLRIIDSYGHLFLSLGKITAVSFLFFLSACSIIPKNEFSNYSNAFEQVREVGEQVLIDYSVAKKERAKLGLKEKPQNPRKTSFNSNQLLISTVSIDDIAIRLKAWKIVGVYNEVLANLIAGRPTKAESGTQRMLHLVVSILRSTTSKLSPYAAAFNIVLTEMQKELKRHEVVRSMERISPMISFGLIKNMKTDTESFYKVRAGLNAIRYRQLRKDVGRHVKAFIKLANIMSVDARIDIVYPIVKRLNTRLEKRHFKRIKLRSKVGGSNGPIIISQLNILKMQIFMLLDKVDKQNQALEAYGEMLTAYVRMLNQLDLHLKIMQQAASDGRSTPIEISKDFNTAQIQMRQAYLYYQNIQ